MNRAWFALGLLLAQAAAADVTCRITAGGGIGFGTYEVGAGTPRDSLLTLTVTCDRNGGPQNVTLLMRLGPGLNGSAPANRRMARTGAPVDYLSYNLYRDPNRTTAWGETDNVDTVSRALQIPNRESRSADFTIYGRIPAGQDVSAGSYSDSVQLTVLY